MNATLDGMADNRTGPRAPAEIEVVATPVPSSLAAAGGPEEQIRVKLRGGPASPGGLIVQDE